MSKVIVDFSISADDFSAGLNQTEEGPIGDDAGNGFGNKLHNWIFTSPEAIQEHVERLASNEALIVWRNMFGPVRGDGNIAVVGGANTIYQYLVAGLIDELRLHINPLTMGAGTRLFDGVPPLNLEQVESTTSRAVTHVSCRMLS